MPFNWSINPYRGCFHGCGFCYARATHAYLGKQADDSFQNHIFVKRNAADALKEQLAKLLRKNHGNVHAVAEDVGLVAIGTATDPYQPIEGKERLTRQCLQVLKDFRVRTSITTRSPLVLRDLDLLREMNIASVNVSISTLYPDVSRNIEPGACYPSRRLEIIRELTDNGVAAGVFLAPILPCLSDGAGDLERLIRKAKQHGASFVSPAVLRLSPDVKNWFFHVMKEHYPHLLSAYIGLYKGSYPPPAYTNPLMEKVRNLLEKHELTNGEPNSGIGRRRGQKHRQAEQLTFSFGP
jgi:DNA repair photolyase